MVFAGSLSTFAIIKESQIHTIWLKRLTMGKRGQEGKSILPRIPHVRRD